MNSKLPLFVQTGKSPRFLAVRWFWQGSSLSLFLSLSRSRQSLSIILSILLKHFLDTLSLSLRRYSLDTLSSSPRESKHRRAASFNTLSRRQRAVGGVIHPPAYSSLGLLVLFECTVDFFFVCRRGVVVCGSHHHHLHLLYLLLRLYHHPYGCEGTSKMIPHPCGRGRRCARSAPLSRR